MSDYERYGDYNEIEEDAPKSKNPVLVSLRILTAAICVGVVALIAFRLIAFNSYPKKAKDFYISETFKEYYAVSESDVDVKTQSLRAPYDDPDLGNFFCDYLYVVEDINQLQITVRYNKSTVSRISKELGIELDDGLSDLFEYRLCASFGEGRDLVYYDTLAVQEFDSRLMYRYNKLVFEDIDFEIEDGSHPYWIRLEISLKDEYFSKSEQTEKENEIYMIPIYEDNENYSKFNKYDFSKSEIKELSK